MSTNSNKKTPSQLIEIIENAKDKETLISAMNDPNADSNVLDAAYERAKELIDISSYEGILFLNSLTIVLSRKESNKGYFELLIKIINETELVMVLLLPIFYPMKDQTYNQIALKAVYEKAKDLHKKDSEKYPHIVEDIAFGIIGFYGRKKGNDNATPELLMEVVKDSGYDQNRVLSALTHKNVTAQMIYDCFKSLDQDNEVRKEILSMFPYLKYLIGPAEDFELIDYKTIFNSQIAKEVALLYFKDYPTKFSQRALERFSRECNISVDLEKTQQPGMNGIKR